MIYKLTDFHKKLIRPACDLHVIANGLARIGRFGGRGRFYYPVLAHSLVVGDAMKHPWRIYGYLHDMVELSCGDIGHPFKIPEQKAVEEAVYYYMLEQLELPQPPDFVSDMVEKYDREAAIAEATVLQLHEVIEVEGRADNETMIYRKTNAWANVKEWKWFSPEFLVGLPSIFIVRCEDAIDLLKKWIEDEE